MCFVVLIWVYLIVPCCSCANPSLDRLQKGLSEVLECVDRAIKTSCSVAALASDIFRTVVSNKNKASLQSVPLCGIPALDAFLKSFRQQRENPLESRDQSLFILCLLSQIHPQNRSLQRQSLEYARQTKAIYLWHLHNRRWPAVAMESSCLQFGLRRQVSLSSGCEILWSVLG